MEAVDFLQTESFDYTKWQQKYYDNIPPEQLRDSMKQFCKAHPFPGKKTIHIKIDFGSDFNEIEKKVLNLYNPLDVPSFD